MSSCSKCNDSGYLTADINGERQFIAFCDCPAGRAVRDRIWEQKLDEAGILREYRDLKFKNFLAQPMSSKQQVFRADTEAYLRNIKTKREAGGIWLIFGDAGTGKTLAASLILKEALKKDYSAKYIIWTDLVDGTFNDDTLVAKVREVDFLAIDDLGKDKTNAAVHSKYTEDILEKIIKPRFSNKMPTILVSSRDYRELCVRYPIIPTMVSPQYISEVLGENFRTRVDRSK